MVCYCGKEQLFKNINIDMLHNLAIPLLGKIYHKEFNSGTPTDIFTPMFIPILFIITKRWKLPKGLITNEWVSKNGINIEWNIIQPKKGTKFWYILQYGWNLEILLKIQIDYTQKEKYYTVPFTWTIWKRQCLRDIKKLELTRSWEEGKKRVIT